MTVVVVCFSHYSTYCCPSSISALLIASRLHEFNRTIGDVLKVVKVHESTMRKRYVWGRGCRAILEIRFELE